MFEAQRQGRLSFYMVSFSSYEHDITETNRFRFRQAKKESQWAQLRLC